MEIYVETILCRQIIYIHSSNTCSHEDTMTKIHSSHERKRALDPKFVTKN